MIGMCRVSDVHLECRRGVPPVDARQSEVHQDQDRACVDCATRHGLMSVDGDHDRVVPPLQSSGERVRAGFVVFDERILGIDDVLRDLRDSGCGCRAWRRRRRLPRRRAERTVNRDPRPGSLSHRDAARPSGRRSATRSPGRGRCRRTSASSLTSACVNGSKILPRLFLGHADARVGDGEHDVDGHVADARASTSSVIVPLARELGGVAQEVQQDLARLHAGRRASGRRSSAQRTTRWFSFFCTSGPTVSITSCTSARTSNSFERQRHLAGFDLRQVEDAVDQLEQVIARDVNPLQVGDRGATG